MARLLLIATVLQAVWGLVPSASKLVIEQIPVELYISLRWTISGLIFLGFLVIKRKWRLPSLKDFAGISVLGILGYGVASLGTLYGLKLGGVTNFALMAALSPVITSAMAIAVLKERPSRLFYVALPLCVLGLGILVLGKLAVSSLSIAASSALCILGAYILEALIFVFSKKFKERVSSVEYLAIAQIAAASIMWLLQGTFYHQTSALVQLTVMGWAAAIFVSVVACVLCYAILYWLLNFIDGHRLALFDGIHTISATVFGILFFDETVSPLMITGGLMILAGLVLGNWPSVNRARVCHAGSLACAKDDVVR